MSHIFISYSRKDKVFARKMVQALRSNKFDTWIDWHDIPKGEDWEKEIFRGIEGAEAFLFLISPDSVNSTYCNKEIVHAVKNGKRILPIVLRDANTKEFLDKGARSEISKRNWIFCREGQDDFDKAIEETRKTIHTDYEWLKYHTELQVKALKWNQKKDNSRLLRGKELREAEQQLVIAGINKDPQPTDLQRSYVAIGRKDDEQRRRRTITALTTGFIVIGIFCVVAAVASFVAVRQRNIAVTESIARATAQTIAEEQETISIGRRLASQSQLQPLYGNSMIVSGLLSIEAAHLDPGLQAQQSLSRVLNSIGSPISRIYSDSIILTGSISSDGKLVAAGDAKGVVRIWDVPSGKEIATIQNTSSVWSLAFSPVDNRIVVGGGDLIVWDPNVGEKIISEGQPSSIFYHSLFSSSGSAVLALTAAENGTSTLLAFDAVTGDEISHFDLDGTDIAVTLSQQNSWAIATQNVNNERLLVHVIDWKEGKKLFERSFDMVYNVHAFHLNNSSIISVAGRRTIEVWDAYSGRSIVTGEFCASAIHSMSLSGDAQKVAVGCDDGTIVVLDAEALSVLMTNKQNDFADSSTYDPVLASEFSRDGNRLVTGGASGTAIVWDIESGEQIARMPHAGNIRYVAYNPVYDWVISGGNESSLAVWKPESGLLEYGIVQENLIQTLFFNPLDNLYIVSGGDNIEVWDVFDKELIQRKNLTSSILSPVIISADGSLIISASEDNTVISVDIDSEQVLAKIQHEAWVDYISLDDNNSRVISGSPLAGYLLWSPYSGQILQNWSLSTDPPVVSPSGDLVGYIVDGDNYPLQNLIIGSLESGEKLLEIADGNVPIRFGPENQIVAFVNSDFRTLRVFLIDSNQELFSARHDGVITSISFSLDGEFIVTTSRDAAIRVWKLSNGEEVAKLTTPTPVRDLAISRDGRLIQYSYDKIAYSWIWKIEDLVEEVCRRLPRNFTREEWKQYLGENLQYRATCPELPIPPG